jgi:phage tail-like protein
MSRGTLDDLASPHPLFDRLPAILRGEVPPAALARGTDEDTAQPARLDLAAERLALAVVDGADRGELFTRRFLEGLDKVLAPAFVTLDCLDAYLDPRLTPPDFLPWLSGLVGIRADERWSDEQLRSLMAIAISLYRGRGTISGLRALVRAYAGVDPEIEDSGGSSVAPLREVGVTEATDPFPGSADAWVNVRIQVPAESPVSDDRLRELVITSVPASVRVTVEVTRTGTRPG